MSATKAKRPPAPPRRAKNGKFAASPKGILPIVTGLFGALPSIVVLVLGLVGGTGVSGIGFWAWNTLWDNPHVYSSGYDAGYAKARAEDDAVKAAQEAAIAKAKADAVQALADAEAIFKKQHEADQNELAELAAEGKTAPGADDPAWDAGVMRHYRNIWGGQH